MDIEASKMAYNTLSGPDARIEVGGKRLPMVWAVSLASCSPGHADGTIMAALVADAFPLEPFENLGDFLLVFNNEYGRRLELTGEEFRVTNYSFGVAEDDILIQVRMDFRIQNPKWSKTGLFVKEAGRAHAAAIVMDRATWI